MGAAVQLHAARNRSHNGYSLTTEKVKGKGDGGVGSRGIGKRAEEKGRAWAVYCFSVPGVVTMFFFRCCVGATRSSAYPLPLPYTHVPPHPASRAVDCVALFFSFVALFLFCYTNSACCIRSVLPSPLFSLLFLLPLASVLLILLSSFFYLLLITTTTTLVDYYFPLFFYFLPCSPLSTTSTLLPFLLPTVPLSHVFYPLLFARALFYARTAADKSSSTNLFFRRARGDSRSYLLLCRTQLTWCGTLCWQESINKENGDSGKRSVVRLKPCVVCFSSSVHGISYTCEWCIRY